MRGGSEVVDDSGGKRRASRTAADSPCCTAAVAELSVGARRGVDGGGRSTESKRTEV